MQSWQIGVADDTEKLSEEAQAYKIPHGSRVEKNELFVCL